MRVVVVLGVTAVYALAYLRLFEGLGPGASALSVVPVALAAWLFGLRAGLLVAALFLPLDTLLTNLAGYPGWDAVLRQDGGAGHAALLVVGLVVGRWHDLAAQLQAQVAERTQAEGALQESEGRFRSLVQHSMDLIRIVDADGFIRYASPFVERALGYAPEELVGSPAGAWVHPDDLARVQQMHADVLSAPGVAAPLEVRLQHRDGSWRHFEVIATNLLDDPSVRGIVLNARDITARKRADEALKQSEERLGSLIQHASDVLIVADVDGTARYVSPSIKRVLGYAPEELAGGSAYGAVHPDDRARVERLHAQLLATADAIAPVELRMRHWNGSWRELELLGRNLLYDPSVGGIVLNIRDITERKQFEARLLHQAFHDPLTRLPNRDLFLDRLLHALARARRHHRLMAVLFLDLDRFKVVNDSLGHDVGDDLLVAVADRLHGCLRAEDTLARLGGDEFTILLEDLADHSEAIRVAERIIDVLQSPLEVGRHELLVTTSIGVVLSATGRERPDELLRDADIAMYRAKGEGKARYAVFDPSMNAELVERLELEADLWRAIARADFLVYYQPVVELATRRIVGLEALVRCEHPERGLVPPAEFVPVAEEMGLIWPIGEWVLEEACRQARDWHAEYPTSPPLVISVNLSARQFQHPELVADITRVLTTTGIDPHSLQLEITESVVMHDAAATIATLRELKHLGVRLAIDDFGTGYSSLSYLKRFPVDTLKVDKSFVDGLGGDHEDTAIVQAVVTLAHTLGLEVIAEGVETATALAYLERLGCEAAQGYLFAAPMSGAAVAVLLANPHALSPAGDLVDLAGVAPVSENGARLVS